MSHLGYPDTWALERATGTTAHDLFVKLYDQKLGALTGRATWPRTWDLGTWDGHEETPRMASDGIYCENSPFKVGPSWDFMGFHRIAGMKTKRLMVIEWELSPTVWYTTPPVFAISDKFRLCRFAGECFGILEPAVTSTGTSICAGDIPRYCPCSFPLK